MVAHPYAPKYTFLTFLILFNIKIQNKQKSCEPLKSSSLQDFLMVAHIGLEPMTFWLSPQ